MTQELVTIDKHYRSKFAKQRRELKQNWTIDQWCCERGIDRKTLERHPRIQDIKTLLDFDQYESSMSDKDREIWTQAWNWVYKKQLPISVYIEKRLLSIVEGCAFRQQRAQQQRETRLAVRAAKRGATRTTGMKSDHNDEAKGSLSADD